MIIEEEIIRALIAVYDPSTSNEQRVQANQIIENFQNNSPVDQVINIGFSLISREENTLNFIGWKFIEEIARYKWNSVPVELHLFLSHKIGDILEKGPPEAAIDSISKVFVAMMEHEWPQNWQEAIPFLEEISHRSYLHSTAVFAILRRLVENVVTLMNVADPYRRRDMYNGIILYMPNILEMSLSCLYSLQNSAADYFGFQTIAYILSFFGEILEWVPSTALAPQLNRMVDIIVGYLNTPELCIYELAANALSSLAERKKETSEECIVVNAFFRQKIIDTILDTVKLAAENSQSNSDHYRYLKALCGLLTSLGSHLAKVWSEKTPPPNFSLYLSAICQIFTHPSLNLKTEALEALSNLSNHSILGQCDSFHVELENILKGLLIAIEKTGYPSQKPVDLAVHYSNMDYDDDAEWNNDLKRLRERARALLTFSLARHFPLLLSILEQNIFQPVVSNSSNIQTVKWEPMATFSKVVVQGGFDKDLFDERAKNGLMTMSDKMIQIMSQISDWDLLNEVLSIHSSLLPVLRLNPLGLTNYMELLQKILLTSNKHVALNRHVISLILRAVILFPEYFKIQENVARAVNLYESVRPAISQMQQAQLLQIFASLSNIVEFEQLKRELLEKCMASTIEYFSNLQGQFDSIEKFITLNGFDTSPNENFEEDDRPDVLRRRELRYHLTIVEGVVQQVDDKSPLGKVDAFIGHLVPVFFKLNSVVLELASPRALSLMNPGYHHVSDMTRAERETIYSSVGESLEIQLGKMEAEKRDTCELSKNYIHHLSVQCMNIIALVASKFGQQFHSHPFAEDMLVSTVGQLNIMPEFRLRHWIRKAWKSLILSLPQERWNQMANFWPILTSHLKSTLDNMWDPIGSDLNGSEQTEAEIFQEHMTCVLSREWLTLLKLIYLGTDSGNQNDVKLSPMGDWLIKNEIGLPSVLSTVFSALCWKDTNTSQKAVPLCKIFVDQMTENYNDELIKYAFTQGLYSLQVHGGDNMNQAALLSLVSHIYVKYRKYSNSLMEILLQIPGISKTDTDLLDKRVAAINDGTEQNTEKKRRDLFKKIVDNAITGTAHRRPQYLRPLPPIEKPKKAESEPKYDAVSDLFGKA